MISVLCFVSVCRCVTLHSVRTTFRVLFVLFVFCFFFFFSFFLFFFFQAEDGIRDTSVTGVQTCALPISNSGACAKTKNRTERE